MRREQYRMDRARALALLQRAPVVHLATTTPDGAPVLKTVHGVVVDDALCFHGAPAGEKSESLGRAAVLGAEEIVAEIPSYFVDPERACPATTYYESVQVHGVLEEVTDLDAKARVLGALMSRFQPEGGHVPITADHPMYKSAVKGILIVRVSLERLDGKGKLGQNRKPEELALILLRLWERGTPADLAAIERVREANPSVPPPAFLAAPDGVQLHMCRLTAADAARAADLLEGAYWNAGVSRETIERSHLGATVWVGARDQRGRLIASARANSDGAKHAWIYDVIVDPEWRGRGLARAVLRLLLAHPAIRHVRNVRLGTRDAQRLYQGLGFVVEAPRPHGWDLLLSR